MTSELTAVDHGADALSKRLMQYDGAEKFAIMLQVFNQKINDIETQAQLFKNNLSVDTAKGINLTLVGDILNATRRNTNDEEYRELLYALITAYNSQGTAFDILNIWKQLVIADEILIFDDYPANFHLYIKGATNFPDYRFLSETTLLAKAAGVGFLGATISKKDLLPVFGFEEDPDPDVDGFSVLVPTQSFYGLDWDYVINGESNTYSGDIIYGTASEASLYDDPPLYPVIDDGVYPGTDMIQGYMTTSIPNEFVTVETNSNANPTANNNWFTGLKLGLETVDGTWIFYDKNLVKWTVQNILGGAIFTSTQTGVGGSRRYNLWLQPGQFRILKDDVLSDQATLLSDFAAYGTLEQDLTEFRNNHALSGDAAAVAFPADNNPTKMDLTIQTLDSDLADFKTSLDNTDNDFGFEVVDNSGDKWKFAGIDTNTALVYSEDAPADGMTGVTVPASMDGSTFTNRVYRNDVLLTDPNDIGLFNNYPNTSFDRRTYNENNIYGLLAGTQDILGPPISVVTYFANYSYPPDDTPDIGYNRYLEPNTGAGSIKNWMIVLAAADADAFETELISVKDNGLSVIDKSGIQWNWIPDKTVSYTVQDQLPEQKRFFIEMVNDQSERNGRLFKDGVEITYENQWTEIFDYDPWFRGDFDAFNAANTKGLGNAQVLESNSGGGYYSILITGNEDALPASNRANLLKGR